MVIKTYLNHLTTLRYKKLVRCVGFIRALKQTDNTKITPHKTHYNHRNRLTYSLFLKIVVLNKTKQITPCVWRKLSFFRKILKLRNLANNLCFLCHTQKPIVPKLSKSKTPGEKRYIYTFPLKSVWAFLCYITYVWAAIQVLKSYKDLPLALNDYLHF